MRINVYAEEIDFDRPPTMERKVAETGDVFYGLRFWMKRSEHLHDRPDDDDTSAVTFWLDFTEDQSHALWSHLATALDLVDNGRGFGEL